MLFVGFDGLDALPALPLRTFLSTETGRESRGPKAYVTFLPVLFQEQFPLRPMTFTSNADRLVYHLISQTPSGGWCYEWRGAASGNFELRRLRCGNGNRHRRFAGRTVRMSRMREMHYKQQQSDEPCSRSVASCKCGSCAMFLLIVPCN